MIQLRMVRFPLFFEIFLQMAKSKVGETDGTVLTAADHFRCLQESPKHLLNGFKHGPLISIQFILDQSTLEKMSVLDQCFSLR